MNLINDTPLLPSSASHKECMADMDTVVDTETHGEHNVDAGDDVDGDVPEVEEPDDVGEADGDHEDDHEADLDVAEEEEGDEDHHCDGEAQVPPQLSPDNDVGFPAGVNLGGNKWN